MEFSNTKSVSNKDSEFEFPFVDIPCSIADFDANSTALWAAKAVPFLEPLKPQKPAEDQETTDQYHVLRHISLVFLVLRLPCPLLMLKVLFAWLEPTPARHMVHNMVAEQYSSMYVEGNKSSLTGQMAFLTPHVKFEL